MKKELRVLHSAFPIMSLIVDVLLFDMTPEQWAVLNRLWEKDDVTQNDLTERNFKDQPNIGRILES